MKRLKRPIGRTPGLMLTALLDMFTILLVFLIVSFDAEDYGLTLRPGLELPKSSARAPLKPGVHIAISSDQILVEGRPVGKLRKGTPSPEDVTDGVIPSVSEALEKAYEDRYGPDAIQGLYEGESTEIREPMLVLQSDKRLPYKTLYLVLRSAARAGFFKYRLAILKT